MHLYRFEFNFHANMFFKNPNCTSRFGNVQQSSLASVIVGNLRKSPGDVKKDFGTFEDLRVIFESLPVDVGNFRNTLDHLRQPLVFSGFLQTNFGNFRCNLQWCDRVALIFFSNFITAHSTLCFAQGINRSNFPSLTILSIVFKTIDSIVELW